jgi:putative hydrolase of the HAD superfamily
MNKLFKNIKTVFLDLDDTLCDTEGLTLLRLKALETPLLSLRDNKLVKKTLAEASTWDPVPSPTGMLGRLQIIKKTLDLTDAQFESIRELYNQVLIENLSLFDSTTVALSDLKNKVKLGMITNGPSKFQRSKIEKLHIEEYFDSIIVSGEFGKHKPHPAIFLEGMKSLNADPETSLHVGDRLDSDIEGAQSVGMRSVLIHNNYPYVVQSSAKPTATIIKINDLLELLR